MNQSERRIYLIKRLLEERSDCAGVQIPSGSEDQRRLLRSLMNVRMPGAIDADFLKIQDEYLQAELRGKGITDIESLTAITEDLYLWQGDITTLKCGAVVNAANSQMLGCFCPCHGCIDNAIHT